MEFVIRATQAGLTLYMLLVLFRWVAPLIQMDIHNHRWLRWIPAVTDPLLDRLRSILPPLGPVDITPLVALLLLWLVRTALVGLLAEAA